MYYWLAGWLASLIDMMKYQTPPSARATLNEKKKRLCGGLLLTHDHCFCPMIVVVQKESLPQQAGQKVRHHFWKEKKVASADDDMLGFHRLTRKKIPSGFRGLWKKIRFFGLSCICICICITQEG